MRPSDRPLALQIKQQLLSFDSTVMSLPGIQIPAHLTCLIEQIIDSVRRVKYVTTISNKTMGNIYADPTSPYFDPIKAAIWHRQNGNINESFWLIFLATHFGRNKTTKWNLIKEVYNGQGSGGNWNWQRTSTNFRTFQSWLHQNQLAIKATGNFSNHRKYISLDAYKPAGTGAAIESYIDWIGPTNDHQTLIATIQQLPNNSPQIAFDHLYRSMNVASFARMGKFDFLTMVGKTRLANIEPGKPYMVGATGPINGAKMLFNQKLNAAEYDRRLTQLATYLNLQFGMQVIEDAICNWQKSPGIYVYFTG